MRFDVLTLFPSFIKDNPYFEHSIIGRAVEQKIIDVHAHDIRDYTKNKHKKVDDTPYGGGAGMLMTCQPLFDSINAVKKKNQGKVVFLTPQGKQLTHTRVRKLAKEDSLILLCGRYEGIDQRVRDELIDEEYSIGPYVLTGGELPAMIMIDAITRQLPGSLHDDESALEDSYSRRLGGKKEYPHYTKPANYKGLEVPKTLLSGNHKEIEKWRKRHLK